MLKTKIGAALFLLGTVTADSEWIVIPVALVLLGAWLMRGLINDTEEHL